MNNGCSIGERNKNCDPTPPLVDRHQYNILPRYMVPVDYGHKKVRYRRKNWLGKVEVATRKKDLGIRWVELKFVNAFVYNLHRKSETITGEQVPEIYSPTNQLNWGISSISATYTRDKSGGIFDVIDSINKLMHSDIPCTLTLAADQYEVDPGTSIFFEVFDSSNVTDANKSKFSRLWNGVVLDSKRIAFIIPGSMYAPTISVTNLTVSRIIKPLAPTQPSLNPINCQLEYKIPHLPTDDDIRDYVFHKYGPMDQGEYAVRWSEFKKLNAFGLGGDKKYTGGELIAMLDGYKAIHPVTPGFEIFPSTSQSIADMKSYYDIHSKASFLLAVLSDAFGASRVKLMETVRSYDDQETLQVGGSSSSFLSWHNYGLAIKINIYEADSMKVIRDGSVDFFKLMKIAESFTDAAYKGFLGAPCNVVWCGRLKTGPNLFVWEFLPIGIDHKDLIKFRDAYLNQMDPFNCVMPVDVDVTNYVVTTPTLNRVLVPASDGELTTAIMQIIDGIDRDVVSDELRELIDDADLLNEMSTSMPEAARIAEKADLYRQLRKQIDSPSVYVTKTSNAYTNAVVYNGHRYISPNDITNYPYARELVMKDIQEYMFMIACKFKAHGSNLKSDQRIIDWKLTNPISFKQMLMYYSLTGSYSVTRSLLAADYVSRYESLLGSANLNPVQFVRDFLGRQAYMDIKIYPDGLERDAGYITLHDGKISVAVMQCRSIHPEGFTNMFGERQASFLTIEFGQLQGGIFVPEYSKDATTGIVTKNRLNLIKSDVSVLSGYAPDGTVIGPKGYTLPSGTKLSMGDGYMLHVLIKDKIIDEINAIRSMFDELKTEFLYDKFSNSPNQNDIIENEFGAIASQDLLSFSDLVDVYRRLDIKNKNDTNSLGDKRGAGNNSLDSNDLYSDPTIDPNRDQSVYEKLVSTTQFTGIQFSRNTKEKPTIEPLQTTKLENILKRLTGDNSPDVRDLI